jgi:branched-chain amino acid transport system ATP-binding protein
MIALEIDNISRSFRGIRAVDQLSFTVERGAVQALIGPNGAGKTTIFNLISGFLRPDTGKITFDGRPIVGLPPYRLAALGLVRTFQLVRLFPDMTVMENVEVGAHTRTRGNFWTALARPAWARRQECDVRAEALDLLEMVGLAHCAELRARTITYGQQRLLEIARGLAAAPQLLLLDEPAAGLNAAETRHLAAVLRRVADRGTTVLFIEHDMNLVMNLAERVVVIDFGRKISEGTPDEVRRHPEVIEAYLGQSPEAPDA